MMQTLELPTFEEQRSKPHESELQQISLDRVLVVKKLTKVQCDTLNQIHSDYRSLETARYHCAASQTIASYPREEDERERIVSSHQAQLRSLASLEEIFEPHQIVVAQQLPQLDLSEYDLIISAGGDDSFKYVAQYVTNQYIVGYNTDSFQLGGTSAGGLLYFDQ